MRLSHQFRVMNVILAFVTIIGFSSQSGAKSQAASRLNAVATAGQHVVYLPIATKASAGTPPSGGGQSGDSATFWLPYTADDGAGIATNNPQVAVDRAGGIHVAYRISARTTNGRWPGYYMHCAAGCADPAHWNRVSLSDNVVDIRLQLDADDHPRLLLKAFVDSQVKEWQYAACDTSCDSEPNWTITPITTSHYADPYIDEQTNHYFALDRAGHPGFVYMDFMNPEDHNGTFYAYCQMADPHACVDVENWSEHRISQQNLVRGDLVYTWDGQARFLMTYTPDDYAVKLAYVECDATCDVLKFVGLWDTDGYAHWSLRLDRSDQPRFALYSGWYVHDIPSRQIFYIWCDADCLTMASWKMQALSPQIGSQQQLDMQLDGQDRPRVVFSTSYAWCNAACQSSRGDWHAKVIETSNTLDQLYPVPAPTDCTESRWASGYIPTLALDLHGNPRVTFVAQHVTSGIHRSDGRSCDGKVDITWARFSMFPQP